MSDILICEYCGLQSFEHENHYLNCDVKKLKDQVSSLTTQLEEAKKTIEAGKNAVQLVDIDLMDTQRQLEEERGKVSNIHIDFKIPDGSQITWLISDIISYAIESVDHLLHQHDCDCMGHEGKLYGLSGLKELLKILEAPTPNNEVEEIKPNQFPNA